MGRLISGLLVFFGVIVVIAVVYYLGKSESTSNTPQQAAEEAARKTGEAVVEGAGQAKEAVKESLREVSDEIDEIQDPSTLSAAEPTGKEKVMKIRNDFTDEMKRIYQQSEEKISVMQTQIQENSGEAKENLMALLDKAKQELSTFGKKLDTLRLETVSATDNAWDTLKSEAEQQGLNLQKSLLHVESRQIVEEGTKSKPDESSLTK